MTGAQYAARVARLRRRADRAQNDEEYARVLDALARANEQRAATVAADRAYRARSAS